MLIPPLLQKGDYIYGSFIKPEMINGYIKSSDPSNKETLIGQYLFSYSSISQAIAYAKASLPQWRKKSPEGRLAPIQKLQEDIAKHHQFIAKTKKTGIFAVAQDTIPPSIKPAQQYDQRWLSNFKTLRFTIDDKETGIRSYRTTIDGKWALFEYEPKKKELTFNFDEYFALEGAKHSLEISVIDNVGNETIHQLEFFRK